MKLGSSLTSSARFCLNRHRRSEGDSTFFALFVSLIFFFNKSFRYRQICAKVNFFVITKDNNQSIRHGETVYVFFLLEHKRSKASQYFAFVEIHWGTQRTRTLPPQLFRTPLPSDVDVERFKKQFLHLVFQRSELSFIFWRVAKIDWYSIKTPVANCLPVPQLALEHCVINV